MRARNKIEEVEDNGLVLLEWQRGHDEEAAYVPVRDKWVLLLSDTGELHLGRYMGRVGYQIKMSGGFLSLSEVMAWTYLTNPEFVTFDFQKGAIFK